MTTAMSAHFETFNVDIDKKRKDFGSEDEGSLRSSRRQVGAGEEGEKEGIASIPAPGKGGIMIKRGRRARESRSRRVPGGMDASGHRKKKKSQPFVADIRGELVLTRAIGNCIEEGSGGHPCWIPRESGETTLKQKRQGTLSARRSVGPCSNYRRGLKESFAKDSPPVEPR